MHDGRAPQVLLLCGVWPALIDAAAHGGFEPGASDLACACTMRLLGDAMTCMAGAVCDDLNVTIGSENYLCGRHVVACDISWCDMHHH